ncbi:hypothetical protein TeGR_g9855 [Tetraparma gracilis]|uniref:Branchpoint-bridging protein n=1 Tax=Tetraparma gracilis TaxID=2962635 RepID=A0ABQ6MKU6_9STRA|nr:hypothetical protein TeGR_g9855 [Tetraparma gracilis]
MSNSVNEAEIAAEERALHKSLHPLLKLWYNSSHNAGLAPLRERHGAFPAMWQEIGGWGGWKDVYRLYLVSTEKQGGGNPNNGTGGNPNNSGGGNPNNGGGGNPNNGGGGNPNNPNNKRPADAAAGEERGRARKSRWGSAPAAAPAGGGRSGSRWGAAPASLTLSNGVTLQGEQVAKYTEFNEGLKKVQTKILTVGVDAARASALPKGHQDRSPSPPPVYDQYGRKTNSREVRWKERYEDEIQNLHEKLFDLNPRLLPSTFKKKKKQIKIWIPVDKHPTFNFIGLIIGPRGKTQKEVSGCCLGLRLVRDLLVVMDDDKNVHKQKQLRELALLNGTLKEDEFCPLCAQRGHRAHECPSRFAKNLATVVVKCAICGDSSHPTRDCPVARANGQAQPDAAKVDADFGAFMAELDGRPPPVQAAVSVPAAPPQGGGGAVDAAINNAMAQFDSAPVAVLGGGGGGGGGGYQRPPPPPRMMGGPGLGAAPPAMGRGRGRGVTNKPAWMEEQEAAGGAVGGGTSAPAAAAAPGSAAPPPAAAAAAPPSGGAIPPMPMPPMPPAGMPPPPQPPMQYQQQQYQQPPPPPMHPVMPPHMGMMPPQGVPPQGVPPQGIPPMGAAGAAAAEPPKELSWLEQQKLKKAQKAAAAAQPQWDPNAYYGAAGPGAGGWWAGNR